MGTAVLAIQPAEVTDDITVLGRIKDDDERIQRRIPGCNTEMENRKQHLPFG